MNDDRRRDLVDLTNVSPLDATRAAWLAERGTSRPARARDDKRDVFPFTVSPMSTVYDPKQRVRKDFGDLTAVVDAVAVVKATAARCGTRVVVPVVARATFGDAKENDGGEDEETFVESRDLLFEARVRAAMEAEAKGVDLDAMFAAKRGVQNSPSGASRTAVAAAVTDARDESDGCIARNDEERSSFRVNERGVLGEVEESPAREETSVDVAPAPSVAEPDAFERMLSKALEDVSARKTNATPSKGKSRVVDSRPFAEVVPKREFQPKLVVSSPEKYASSPPLAPTTSALDFEAKLEAAMRAAEMGGDLTAILSGPSSKVMNSPVGADAQKRVNFRELGISKSELKHHELHVANSDVALG